MGHSWPKWTLTSAATEVNQTPVATQKLLLASLQQGCSTHTREVHAHGQQPVDRVLGLPNHHPRASECLELEEAGGCWGSWSRISRCFLCSASSCPRRSDTKEQAEVRNRQAEIQAESRVGPVTSHVINEDRIQAGHREKLKTSQHWWWAEASFKQSLWLQQELWTRSCIICLTGIPLWGFLVKTGLSFVKPTPSKAAV